MGTKDTRKRQPGLLALAERSAWIAGSAMLLAWLAATSHASLSAKRDVERFQEQIATASMPDMSSWSEKRRLAYATALEADLGLPEALLKIEKIGLVVPVWAGIDDLTLNRAVGRVPDTPAAGRAGNAVLAAHRDGFFRKLGTLQPDDVIEVETLTGRHLYRVQFTTVVDPDAVEVMAPTEMSALTLVTCYPFDFIGPAPKRFVVRAVNVDS